LAGTDVSLSTSLRDILAAALQELIEAELTKAAKVPAIRLHDVRQSYATAALNSGVPVKVLS